MTSVRSFSEILLEAGQMDGPEAQRFLRIIHDESLRLTRLLDQILDLSVLERGQVRLPVAPTDAADALRRAVDTVRGVTREAKAEVQVRVDEPELWVQGEPDRLAQVFINLLSNAVKYSNRAQPQVWVEATREGGQVVIAIQDDGPGVIEADRERIFQKFSRGWDRKDPGGAGLGLAISREILRRFGGDLTLARPQAGARFECRLTAADRPADAAAAE